MSELQFDLTLFPAPVLLGTSVVTAGAASFSLPLPSDASALVGQTYAFQAIHVAATLELEFSGSVVGTVAP